MSNAVELEQQALLDLSGREFNQLWVDDNAPLFVANNPLHWKAHKLQVALARLDKIAEKNPAQFNSTVYMATLDKLAELMEQINNNEMVAKANEILDEQNLESERTGSEETAAVGEGTSLGLDPGISADNPLSR